MTGPHDEIGLNWARLDTCRQTVKYGSYRISDLLRTYNPPLLAYRLGTPPLGTSG